MNRVKLGLPSTLLALAVGVAACRRPVASVDAVVAPPNALREPVRSEMALPAGWENRPATAAYEVLLASFDIRLDRATIDRECPIYEEGASIDEIESSANAHGLVAEQVMVAPEYVLLPESKSLPALYVGVDANGVKEFGFVQKRNGDRVSVFRPSSGHVDLSAADFLQSLFIHEMPITRAQAAGWFAGGQWANLVEARMKALGLASNDRRALLDEASGDASMIKPGALDAAVRWTSPGTPDAAGVVHRAFDCAARGDCTASTGPSASTWWFRPAPAIANAEPPVILRGAVLVVVRGRR